MKFITIAALIGFSSNALAAAVPVSIGQVDEEHAESNFLRGSTSDTIVCHGITLKNPNGCHCPRKDKTVKGVTCPNQGVHNEATVCCTGPGAAWSWVQCSGLMCLGDEEDYSADQSEAEEDALAMVES